jgi:hypothetical protein
MLGLDKISVDGLRFSAKGKLQPSRAAASLMHAAAVIPAYRMSCPAPGSASHLSDHSRRVRA